MVKSEFCFQSTDEETRPLSILLWEGLSRDKIVYRLEHEIIGDVEKVYPAATRFRIEGEDGFFVEGRYACKMSDATVVSGNFSAGFGVHNGDVFLNDFHAEPNT